VNMEVEGQKEIKMFCKDYVERAEVIKCRRKNLISFFLPSLTIDQLLVFSR